MSKLIVEVCLVEEVQVHENADRLERVRVKNWWCVCQKGCYQVGDKVVYVPPDAILPEELANRWGIAKYCVPLAKDISGTKPPGLRVRASRLRGVSSFGTIQKPDLPEWKVGEDVLSYYGITKYEPPLKSTEGDVEKPINHFHEYTSIENIGNFPNTFIEGEEVLVSEKLHGTNSRVGMVYVQKDDGEWNWEFVAGSHSTRRKEYNDKGIRSKYWFPFNENDKECPMRELLLYLKNFANPKSSIIVFGEIFGAGVQDMQYGQKGLAYRAFDIAIDGNYLSSCQFLDAIKTVSGKILTVPYLYQGPFSMKKMEELVDGPTTIAEISEIKEPFKGREGIVIRPKFERFDPIIGGRCLLKFISVDYHERKNKDKSEDH